jgi:hypothetical protein
MTPTIVNKWPFRRIWLPTMLAWPPKRLCHKRWLTTATGCPIGVMSSLVDRSRPWLAERPSTSKRFPVTMAPPTTSVSPSMFRLASM